MMYPPMGTGQLKRSINFLNCGPNHVAKFIGFAQFYSMYIDLLELCIAPLREITIKLEYLDPVAPLWLDAARRS